MRTILAMSSLALILASSSPGRWRNRQSATASRCRCTAVASAIALEAVKSTQIVAAYLAGTQGDDDVLDRTGRLKPPDDVVEVFAVAHQQEIGTDIASGFGCEIELIVNATRAIPFERIERMRHDVVDECRHQLA